MILLDTYVLSEFMRPRPIALAHRMPLATRNTADFELIDGLGVVNPWTDGA